MKNILNSWIMSDSLCAYACIREMLENFFFLFVKKEAMTLKSRNYRILWGTVNVETANFGSEKMSDD